MSRRQYIIAERFYNNVQNFAGHQITIGNLLIDTDDLYFFRLSEGCTNLKEELQTRINQPGHGTTIAKTSITLMQAAILSAFARASQTGNTELTIDEIGNAVYGEHHFSADRSSRARSIRQSMEKLDTQLFGTSEVIAHNGSNGKKGLFSRKPHSQFSIDHDLTIHKSYEL